MTFDEYKQKLIEVFPNMTHMISTRTYWQFTINDMNYRGFYHPITKELKHLHVYKSTKGVYNTGLLGHIKELLWKKEMSCIINENSVNNITEVKNG